MLRRKQINYASKLLDNGMSECRWSRRDPQGRKTKAQAYLEKARSEAANDISRFPHQTSLPGLHGLSTIDVKSGLSIRFQKLYLRIFGLVERFHNVWKRSANVITLFPGTICLRASWPQ
jgi:hypothetical protein